MTISSNLASGARRALRAAAHHLDPVVMIGDKGLSAAVLHEIDIALTAHALIKVRVASDDREQRIAFMNEICEKLGSESVQHLGKLLVLWRNKEDGSDVEDFVEDASISTAAPAERSRGPRKKLADDGMRRPTERDPKPRAPRDSGYAPPRSGGYGAAKPAGYGNRSGAGAIRGAARGNDRGEGYAPRGTGGYARDNDGTGYKPRTSGFGISKEGGFNRRGADDSAGRSEGAADTRRFRRAGDAPAPDTRPPREGWAPRNRRGEGRNDSSGDQGQGVGRGRSRDDTAGGNFGGGAAAPRGRSVSGGYGNSAGYGGASSGAARGGYGDSRPPRSGRAPAAGAARSGSGDGRWGSRGGSAASAPKPRARRRLG